MLGSYRNRARLASARLSPVNGSRDSVPTRDTFVCAASVVYAECAEVDQRL